jgi:hypothetical protein
MAAIILRGEIGDGHTQPWDDTEAKITTYRDWNTDNFGYAVFNFSPVSLYVYKARNEQEGGNGEDQ